MPRFIVEVVTERTYVGYVEVEAEDEEEARSLGEEKAEGELFTAWEPTDCFTGAEATKAELVEKEVASGNPEI